MGKVESFSLSGLRLWFNSYDHRPPHFHVKKPSAWEIRVFILTTQDKNLDFNVKFNTGKKLPTSAEQKEIAILVVNYREQLLLEWESKVFIQEKLE